MVATGVLRETGLASETQPSVPAEGLTASRLPSRNLRVGGMQVLEHFATVSGDLDLRTHNQTPWNDFRGMIEFMDDRQDAQPVITRDKGQSWVPFYLDAAMKEHWSNLSQHHGIVPLFSFDTPAVSPTGKSLVVGVRPHGPALGIRRGQAQTGEVDHGYGRLRDPKELAATLQATILPNLHSALGRHEPFQASDVTFVFLPNEQFSEVAGLQASASARKTFLRVLDAEYNGLSIARFIIREGLQVGASDVQLSPMGQKVRADGSLEPGSRYRVQFEVDGVLQTLPIYLTQEAFQKTIQAIETLATNQEGGSTGAGNSLNPHVPFDGQLNFIALAQGHAFTADESLLKLDVGQVDGVHYWPIGIRGVEMRIGRVPTVKGAHTTLRFHLPSSFQRLTELGSTPHQINILRRTIKEPKGLVLMTGPTGSGKTSTLYAALHELNDGTKHILTVEDPVEKKVEGLTQIQISKQLPFKDAIRIALRKAPKVILLGEVRDAESAQAAVDSALTGHLVLSTLHTLDAGRTILRLDQLGIESSLLGDCLKAIMSQRLLARINPAYLKKMPDGSLTPDERYIESYCLTDELSKLFGGHQFSAQHIGLRPKEFDQVGETDYRPHHGRTTCFEILTIDREIRKQIDKSASPEDIVRIAMEREKSPYVPMELHGLLRVLNNQVTLPEMVRVFGEAWVDDELYRNAAIGLIERWLSYPEASDDQILYGRGGDLANL